ncbi:hypothetical protein L2E82_15198 [Cichorium intybus]|uniref:Uncharacterized protein n=1 Tax=Cichorium intybus TaxID=13427 RepID=A0ACB9F2H7_CICIN|nr:hypothetical protein L2E82_15198 [Cichorium intybus]
MRSLSTGPRLIRSFGVVADEWLCAPEGGPQAYVGAGKSPSPDRGSAANYTRNSTYQRNLDNTLSGLPNTNSGFGFFNFSIGQGNDRVNSIALCRGDVESDLCRSCVDDSIVKLRERCPSQREAIGFYDTCMLQYSNETILGNNRTNINFYFWNPINASDGDRFNGSPGPLLNRLIAEAAAGGPLLKFATGNTSGPNFPTIYGLVQCTPDLSEAQCSTCLDDSIQRFVSEFTGMSVGGRIFQRMCIIRYETFRFFNGSTLIIPPSSLPSPPISVVSPPTQPPSGKDSNITGQHFIAKTNSNSLTHDVLAKAMDIGTVECLQYDFSTIDAATNNFSNNNKLGKGGFGAVYKGNLGDGQEIAVKRLARDSGQDFGMARLFNPEETEGDTNRIVGTYGYMAPEYAMHGQFSVKSDVFSFGVLVLEMVTGQKNQYIRNGESIEDLLSYAWKSWQNGTVPNIIDRTLMTGSSSLQDITRSIHIGLLCVQENSNDRPTMASVVRMLDTFSLSLEVPSEPAFFMHSTITIDPQMPLLSFSVNDVSVSELVPR